MRYGIKSKFMTQDPLISVIMPVFNNEKFVKEAIGSILQQDYTNFEFIIINDGSTDGTLNIIKEITDDRIILINNPQNLGVVKSLNKGLKISKGEFIARMDSDDICFKDRLSRQVNCLMNNSNVDIVCANAIIVDENKKVLKVTKYHRFKNLRKVLFALINPIIHPTVMFRKSISNDIDLLYDENYENLEDFELWLRLTRTHKICYLKKNMILFRRHSNNYFKQYGLDFTKLLIAVLNERLFELKTLKIDKEAILNVCQVYNNLLIERRRKIKGNLFYLAVFLLSNVKELPYIFLYKSAFLPKDLTKLVSMYSDKIKNK